MGTQKARIDIVAKDKASNKVKQIDKNFNTLFKGVKAFISGKIFIELARQVSVFIGQGVKSIKVEKSFSSLTSSFGINSKKILEDLNDVAQGTISTFELMEKSNKALLLTNGLVAKDLPKLLEIARASAEATGEDIGFLFDSIITGIGRSSPMILDNLGLTIKLGEANKEYAISLGKTSEELTENEKKQALLNEVLKSGQDLINKSGVESENTLDSYKRLSAESKNLADNTGKILANSFDGFADSLANVIDKINGILETSDKFELENMKKEALKLRLELGMTSEKMGAIGENAQLLAKKDVPFLQKTFIGFFRDLKNKGLDEKLSKLANIESVIRKEEELIKKREIEKKEKKDAIDLAKKEEEQNRKSEEESIKRNSINKEISEAKKKQKQAEIESENAINRQRVEDAQKTAIQIEEVEKQRVNSIIGFQKGLSDAVSTIGEDGGEALLNFLKQSLNAQIDAWVAAETAKALAAAPLTLGATIGAVAPITAAGAAGKAAVNSIQFANGGSYITDQPNIQNNTAGQPVLTGESGAELVSVEPLRGQITGNTEKTIVTQVYLDGRQIAKAISPYSEAIRNGRMA